MITTPIIFLDVDGVLNSHQYFEEREKQKSQDSDYIISMKSDIDPEAVKRLNRICEATGAKIVVSSVWRRGRLYDILLEVLEEYGCKDRVIGVTGYRGCSDCLRGNEIHRWMKDNIEEYYNFKNYVIIDDDGDMLYWQKDNFVHTSSERGGLTEELADKAIEILLSSKKDIEYGIY